jgi:hypothetical protein
MYTLIVFLLNNILWMFFLYLLLPQEKKKEIKLKFPEMPFMEKKDTPQEVNREDLVDLDSVSFPDAKKSLEEQFNKKNKGK